MTYNVYVLQLKEEEEKAAKEEEQKKLQVWPCFHGYWEFVSMYTNVNMDASIWLALT